MHYIQSKIRETALFQVFIKTIINFVNYPLDSNENLYSREQLYGIIFPSLALILLLSKATLGFILEKIFGVEVVLLIRNSAEQHSKNKGCALAKNERTPREPSES